MKMNEKIKYQQKIIVQFVFLLAFVYLSRSATTWEMENIFCSICCVGLRRKIIFVIREYW